MTDHEWISLCKVLAYWDMFGIVLSYKESSANGKPEKFVMSQISFFKLVDLVGLLTMFQSGFKYHIQPCGMSLKTEETYLDTYDVQPFRQYLFESKRATAEINLIMRDIGYTDKNLKINNYDNNMEFSVDSVKNVLLYCAHLIDSWEHFEELNYLREVGWKV
jgi:hypothetical protein